jgi:hypothetical protein
MMDPTLLASRHKLRRAEGVRDPGTDQSIGPAEPTTCPICQPSPCGRPIRHNQIVGAGLAGTAPMRNYAGPGNTT